MKLATQLRWDIRHGQTGVNPEDIECWGCFRVVGESCSPACRQNDMTLEEFLEEEDA